MAGAGGHQSPLLRGSDWSQECSVAPAYFGVSPSGCGQALVALGVHLSGSSEGWWRPHSNLRCRWLRAWPASSHGVRTMPRRAVAMCKGGTEARGDAIQVELRCELAWQVAGEPGPGLFSPRLILPDLRRPPAPSQRGPAPLSHGEPQQVPQEAWASNNSRRPGADPARYQGRRSRAIWPRSCPGGLTFPAPFQRNPTPRAVLSLPQARPARLPPLSTDQKVAGCPRVLAGQLWGWS